MEGTVPQIESDCRESDDTHDHPHSKTGWRQQPSQLRQKEGCNKSRMTPLHPVEAFSSPHIEMERITLKSKKQKERAHLGLFNKGKTSVRGCTSNKRVPDAIFSELEFFRRPSSIQRDDQPSTFFANEENTRRNEQNETGHVGSADTDITSQLSIQSLQQTFTAHSSATWKSPNNVFAQLPSYSRGATPSGSSISPLYSMPPVSSQSSNSGSQSMQSLMSANEQDHFSLESVYGKASQHHSMPTQNETQEQYDCASEDIFGDLSTFWKRRGI